MAQAKTIKDQAASAKRAATAIRNLIEQLQYEKVLDKSSISAISIADRDVLIKAASILAKVGASKTQVAKKAKAIEVAREHAIVKAETEAKRIFASWPAPETVADKIILIIGSSQGHSLQHYLVDGLPIYGNKRESTPEDWRDMLDRLYEEAQRIIPTYAANFAVTKSKSIAEVMTDAAERLAMIKTKPGTLALVNMWQKKLNSE